MAIYDYSSGGFPASPAADDTLAMKGTTYKYNGSAWEVQTGGTTSYTYTATSGQTAFTGADSNSKTLAYSAGNTHVFLNGVLLDAADYTATDGTTVTLGTGASTGDTLQIVAYGVLVSSGGGGGGWTTITSGTITSGNNVTHLDFTGIPTSYNDLRIIITDGMNSGSSLGWRRLRIDFGTDATFATLREMQVTGYIETLSGTNSVKSGFQTAASGGGAHWLIGNNSGNYSTNRHHGVINLINVNSDHRHVVGKFITQGTGSDPVTYDSASFSWNGGFNNIRITNQYSTGFYPDTKYILEGK